MLVDKHNKHAGKQTSAFSNEHVWGGGGGGSHTSPFSATNVGIPLARAQWSAGGVLWKANE